MAKSFKNLPLPGSAAPIKRASERDFFDLSDDSHSAPVADLIPKIASIPVAVMEAGGTHHQGPIDNTGNTHHIGKPAGKKRAGSNRGGDEKSYENIGVIGNKSNTANPGLLDNMNMQENDGRVMPSNGGRDVRQTFVLSQGHLEQLRDHVHARRVAGDYNYSQKQALQLALDLLFAHTTPVSPRPEQVRELEKQRRERIQQGRLSRK